MRSKHSGHDVRRTLALALGGLAAGLALSLAAPAVAASDGSLDPHQARSLAPDTPEPGGVEVAAHHENPCNPCGGENPCSGNPCNPCAGKNPCNPCGGNPCNPCSGANPCNPCGANPCNPCGANPCNPCGANPCNPCGGNPCNPCGGASVDPSRFQQPEGAKLALGERNALIREGERLWNDRGLGKSGVACATCHAGKYGQMNASFAEPYPHRVAMPHQQAGVDRVNAAEMVNFCMIVPMGDDPLPWDSQELAALTAYVEHIQEGFEPSAANACNPCGVNPCNPCSEGRNPCGY